MDEKPLVSIALCTYNGERFLKEQLDSIVNQSYSNIELIAVDDCSSDSTLKILRDYAEKYPFIKVFSNTENLGYIRNFEKAMRLCNGPLIALSDQDDIWSSDKIEKQVQSIGNNMLIYHDSEFIDQQGKSLNKYMSDVMNLYRGDEPEVFLFFNCISGHSVLLKKELLDKMLPFPDAYFHDWWMGYVATNAGSIDYISEALVKYRQHENADTNILKRDLKKRKKAGIKSSELYKRKVQWLKSCAEYPFNKNTKLIKKIYEEIIKNDSTYISAGLAKLIYLNRSLLFKINKKSNYSKLNFILKEIWGGKIRKLFSL
ncbi:Glycosyl transferase family 2 [Daejeonella rubra]|uniref:Glycosyl transferase family 2 n=1 Tax=Daejeonella rubra TaxID=990371 RepID=A0A1G9R3L8_9SPHI|nr:glycosyltransferase family 2 protein [Daejeonella rubra]SDM17818.1 Glycosyl transferase family 2 [Daejeonella rubra]